MVVFGVGVLQLLPEGFSIPDPVYLVPLLLFTLGVFGVLLLIEPDLTDWTVAAFAPWMLLGAIFHVLYQQAAFPDIVEPLFGAPSVYITTFALAGLAWILSKFLAQIRRQASEARQLGVIGTGFSVVFFTFSLYIGVQTGGFTPKSTFWPVVGVIVAGIVAVIAWVLLSLTFTDAAAITGVPGAFVVFSHSLDGVTTTIATDVLAGFGERTPLSARIIEFAAGLPTEPYLGTGWLFLVVKVVLALIIVSAVTDLYREEPVQARILLGFVAAVGFGPGVNNLLLFIVMSPT